MIAHDYIVLDLETQRSIQEVGGRSQFHKLGVSIAVIYDSTIDTTEVYREERISELIRRLQNAEQIVGFNVLHFDYPVLSGYGAVDWQKLPTIDLMRHIIGSLGFRLSLDNLARSTLNVQKSATGLQAIQWYRDGEWNKLIDYCRNDVLLTRDLYEFGKQHGHVLYYDGKFKMKRKAWVTW